MTPIRDLLERVRWDAEFGRARFEIGYYDRVANAIVRAPFDAACLPPGEHFFFEAAAPDGSLHEVPLHRVREVWRDGVLIWRRPAPPAPR